MIQPTQLLTYLTYSYPIQFFPQLFLFKHLLGQRKKDNHIEPSLADRTRHNQLTNKPDIIS